MADKASIVQVQFWRIEFIVEIENQDEENSLIFLRSVYMPNIYEVEMMKSIAIHGLDDQGKATRREQFTDLFGTWTNRILQSFKRILRISPWLIRQLLVILGYLIKYKGKIQLIAGVCKDDDQIKDKQGFASLVGGIVLLLGIIFCTGAVGIYLSPNFKNFIEPVLLLSLLVTIILTYMGGKKYIEK